MLDLAVVLQEFKLQKDKIERAIDLLEALQQTKGALPEVPADPVVPKQRGRKYMGPEERQEVAARMRKYWAKRRKRKLA